MDIIPVSVIIPVKNEEKNLSLCLEKLNDFSEVIVVDSNSTDNTPSIVKQYGCKLVNFDWNGKFPKKRNWTLQNVPLKNQWVLFLDADEYITPEFVKELKQKISNTDVSGFWLNYNNHFMGKQLKFGDKMKKLALFKKDKGAYEQIQEDHWSHLDMEVHEHPVINGKAGKLKSPIIHNDYKGLEHYLVRHEAYANWEARRFLSLEENGFKELNFRQKLKYHLLRLGVLPILYFLGSYILKVGFLDGKEGYVFAKYKAKYFRKIQQKIKDLKAKQLN